MLMAPAFPKRVQSWLRRAGTAAAIGLIAGPLSAQTPVSASKSLADLGSVRAGYDDDSGVRPASVQCPPPPVPCPTIPYPLPYVPGTMSVPGTPTQPGATPNAADVGPSQTAAPAGPNADLAGGGAFGAAPSAGTGGGSTFNVNMYGDSLGGHSVQVTRSRTFADFVRIPLSSTTSIVPFYTANGTTLSSVLRQGHTLYGVPIGNPTFTAQSPPVLGQSVGLLENTGLTSLLQHSSLAQPGETVKFVSGQAIVSPVFPNDYSIYETYKFTSTTQVAAGGGVVGRQKMSEDTSPLPRDRIIFDFDYFGNANLGSGGIDIQRIVVGFEKTFFDGRASIEVRIPFASTLDSSSEIGVQSRNTELGDIRITPRALVYKSDSLNIGAGVGFYLPTASDTRLRDEFGTELLRFSEDSFTVSPYIGVLYTPNDRFFAQGWVSCDIDTNGDAVSANMDGTGLTGIGRFRNGTQMNWDAQIGYWLISPSENSGRLRGLAPFLELHYGSQISNSSTLQAGDYQIATTNNGDELNLTAGISAQIGERLNIQIGGVVPLINSSREFDWQIGIRMNYFFGPTAANASRATYVP
jgi:hypothetical protein